jgi:ParB family chromosome partitioning protein
MLTAGHAKAILSLATEMDQLRVANLIVKKGLSVRETEALASRRAAGTKPGTPVKKDQNIADIEASLQQLLGTRVKIFHGKKRGRILIEYYSNDDLNRVLDILQTKKS